MPETKKGKANCLVDSSMNSRQFTLVTKVINPTLNGIDLRTGQHKVKAKTEQHSLEMILTKNELLPF